MDRKGLTVSEMGNMVEQVYMCMCVCTCMQARVCACVKGKRELERERSGSQFDSMLDILKE